MTVAQQPASHPPIVDLSNFEARRSEIVQQLMEAATTSGFMYVKGDGIPRDLVARAFEASKTFFAQPDEEKNKLPRVDWATSKVIGFEKNRLSDGTVHESIMMAYDVHEEMRKAWPDVPGYKETSLAFMNAMQPVSQRILSCFATGLGLPDDYFEEMTDVSRSDNKTFLQYHLYPKTEGLTWKEGTNRITAHTDESLITLLWPGPGSVGLELAAGRDGKAVQGQENGVHEVEIWKPCPQIDGCIVVNIGDPLQMVSEGLLKSNYHRVRMPKPHEPQGDRYSMAYFSWPCNDIPIKGLSGKHAPTTMSEFMKQKGKNYAMSFSYDPEEYEAAQKYAYGAPAQQAAVGA